MDTGGIKGIKYLGIKISDNSQDLLLNSVLPLKNHIRNKVNCWKKIESLLVGQASYHKYDYSTIVIIHIPELNRVYSG